MKLTRPTEFQNQINKSELTASSDFKGDVPVNLFQNIRIRLIRYGKSQKKQRLKNSKIQTIC